MARLKLSWPPIVGSALPLAHSRHIQDSADRVLGLGGPVSGDFGELTREHLDDFVKCYRPGEPRDIRIETERFKPFSYDELITRDKVNLDITWLKDPSLEDADSLLPPEVIAREIVDDLTAALAEFAAIADALDQVSNRPRQRKLDRVSSALKAGCRFLLSGTRLLVITL
jgi:hypothetical protein